MVVYSILPHAEYGPYDHRKDAPLFTCNNTNFICHLQDWLYKMQMIVHKVDPLDTGQKKGYLGHGKHRFKYLGYIEGLVRDGCFGFLVI